MDALLRDVRYAARSLGRQPGFALAAVCTIALGITATTVVFSLVSALLLKPLPVAEPERLVTVHEQRRGEVEVMMGFSSFPLARYQAYRDASREVLSGLAGHHYDQGSLRTEAGAEVVNSVAATANYFEVLGVRPVLGTGFSSDADRTGAPQAVISHALWSARFGADPGVIGRTLHLDSRALTVVGVAPRGFAGIIVGLPVDVWMPASPGDGADGGTRLTLLGRLRPGMTPERASAALAVVSRQVPPGPRATVEGVKLQALTAVPGDFRGHLIGFMAMLFVTAALVLTIASTNVGGMLLARAEQRRREIAVRLAVGAGRLRLVRQLVTESLVLFLAGGALGVLLSSWLVRLASAFPLPIPARVELELGIDLRVLAFSAAAALVAGVVFGLAPALQATRGDVVAGLRDGGRGQAVRRTRLRSALVVAQLAMSLLLLVTAGLFARTLQNALAAEIGFNPDGVVVAGIDLAPHGYDEPRARRLQAQLLERVRALPGVTAAAYAVWPPMGGNSWTQTVEPGDPPANAAGEAVVASLGTVGAGYFETLEVPLVAGRGFAAADGPGATPVVVVDETLARRLWPGASPLGRHLEVADESREVIGVARSGKYESYTEEERAFAYLPLEQCPTASATLHVRSRMDDGATLAAIRRELAALDPNLALEQAMPLPTLIGFSIFPQRLAAMLIGAFGLTGLLLAAIGLYGILAYQVSARTREIGIRMALGARAAGVVRLVVGGSLRLLLIGTALGLAAAFGVTRLLAGLLFGVTATDPATFVAVSTLLAGVALLASWLPARRATRVDPMIALRAE